MESVIDTVLLLLFVIWIGIFGFLVYKEETTPPSINMIECQYVAVKNNKVLCINQKEVK